MIWNRLLLTYSAVASLAAAGFLTLRGEWIAPTVLSIAALVMVMARVGIDADMRGLVASITPRRERVGGVLVVGLLVMAAIGAPFAGSPVAPASATHDCSETQRLATFSFGLGGYATDQFLFDGKCTDSHRAQAIEDMQDSDANQTHLDIYNSGLQQKAETETRSAVYDNYLNDTESAAWMQAEMAIAQAYENGSSKALAKSKAQQAIQEYYVVKQINLIESYNASAKSADVMLGVAQNESALTAENVLDANAGAAYTNANSANSYFIGTVDTSVTLANGTAHGVKAYRFKEKESLNGRTRTDSVTVNQVSAQGETQEGSYYHGQNVTYLRIKPPNSDYDQVTYIRFADYANRWDRIESQNSALQSEVDVFVENTWQAYESGQIDAADVLSRNTQMFRYGQSAVDGTNSTYDVVAALSSMGLDSPELNGTGTMEVQYKGATYNGFLMARNAPNGSWQAGTTYNTSNITGPVLLAHTGGKTTELSGEFTVSSITNEEGGQINEVTTKKVVYKTSNTSEQLEKMNRILELREEIESREPKASGGAAETNEGLFERLAALLGISVGGAAAILAVAGLVYLKVTTPS